MSHGYTTDKRGDDPLVALADEVMTEFSLGVQAGAWIVDLMPFRKLLLTLKYVQQINDVTLFSEKFARLDARDRLQAHRCEMEGRPAQDRGPAACIREATNGM